MYFPFTFTGKFAQIISDSSRTYAEIYAVWNARSSWVISRGIEAARRCASACVQLITNRWSAARVDLNCVCAAADGRLGWSDADCLMSASEPPSVWSPRRLAEPCRASQSYHLRDAASIAAYSIYVRDWPHTHSHHAVQLHGHDPDERS